ncbi:hypothetical protein RJZ90_008050 [Blastomyces dermatitidis]
MADRGSGSPADASRDSRSSIDSRSPTSNNAPFRLGTMPPLQPRHSFSDSLRAAPSSPRARRQPSLPQSAVQSLIDNPPSGNAADPAFAGRDWTQISIGELVTPSDLRFVEMDTGIEEATKVLIDSGIPVIMIREKPEDKAAIGTFDYADLNAYLLLVVGLVQPSEEHVGAMRELAKKARDGKEIPLRDVKKLGLNVPITNLPPSASLMRAVEIFGGGIHRIIVTREGTNEVVGIFSQWRLVKFLWENGQSFPVIDQLYPRSLAELKIGSQQVISINGDRPLSEALELMNSEGISSIAVVDNQLNVVGNISVVDVKSPASSGPSTPSHSTVHIPLNSPPTVPAQPRSPSPPPSTPLPSLGPTPNNNWNLPPPTATPHLGQPHNPAPQPPAGPPQLPYPPSISTSIPAASLPSARLSGHLVGLVSLTDILNLYARASGLSPADPSIYRSQRRRSSSSSLGIRKSGDVGRDIGRDVWNRGGT